jgi:hypothetical protein
MANKRTKPVSINKRNTYIHAVLLLVMTGIVVWAIKPWGAWSNTDYNFHGLNLFSFFTVQSNFIAAIVYIVAAFALLCRAKLGAWFSYLRGAAVLYMLVTGIVYALLLQNNPDASPVLGFNWANFILHQFNPVFIIGWWLVWRPQFAIRAAKAFYWLIFPAIWLIYTYVRARYVHWYPYPFLDPGKLTTTGITVHIIATAVGFVILAQLIAWVGRVRVAQPEK